MNARPHLALTAPAPAGGLAGRRTRAPRARRHERFRRRGSEIRALIADLRELTESLRMEGADGAALAAKRSEIEVKQSRLADAVRRDPTFGQTAPGAAPRCDPPAVQLAYEGHAQRGLEHHEAVAATAVQLQVSVHGAESALAAREPAPAP